MFFDRFKLELMTQACAHDIDDTFTHCFDQVKQMRRSHFWWSRSLKFQPLCIASKLMLVALLFVSITNIFNAQDCWKQITMDGHRLTHADLDPVTVQDKLWLRWIFNGMVQ